MAYLITGFLHGDYPPGILVRVGVAVVLEVGVVPLDHHTELAALGTPARSVGEFISSAGSVRQNGPESIKTQIRLRNPILGEIRAQPLRVDHSGSDGISEIFFTLFNKIFSGTDGRGGPGWPLQSVLVPEEHWKQDSSVR